LSSSDQGFPVRFSHTIDRFEPARVGRLRATTQRPGLAFVTLRDRTFVVRTHAERVTRRGRQTLVSVQGRLTWVASHRVQPLPSAETPPACVTGDVADAAAVAPSAKAAQSGQVAPLAEVVETPGVAQQPVVAQGDLA
jgi:hypothetical protein